ncbi:MAG: hypothetical protein JWQ44_1169 [Chthoniobacter sp.]|nr:hypothetical protein [Chthoniobacter sp.]
MNQPESEFENELRTLRPAPPEPALEERIAKRLEAASGVATSGRLASQRTAARSFQAWLSRLGWAASGALATVALLTLNDARDVTADSAESLSRTVERTPADALKHVESRSELLEAEDEGLFYASETNEPVRQVRYHFRELHAWRDAETGALVEVEVPREDVRFMPVAMQ